MAENIVEQLINSNDLWKHKRFVRYKDSHLHQYERVHNLKRIRFNQI